MGMSQFYGQADDQTSIGTIRAAIDLGVNFFDTADGYGAADITWGVGRSAGSATTSGCSGRRSHGRRDEVVLATKFGGKINDANDGIAIDGRPEYVAAACDASLQRLGVDAIDLYYYHRLDPNVPIEDTVGAMSELVAAGKVRAIGLSEVGPEVIRRAHAVHPITALQSEYSLWERGVEGAVTSTRAANSASRWSPSAR